MRIKKILAASALAAAMAAPSAQAFFWDFMDNNGYGNGWNSPGWGNNFGGNRWGGPFNFGGNKWDPGGWRKGWGWGRGREMARKAKLVNRW